MIVSGVPRFDCLLFCSMA